MKGLLIETSTQNAFLALTQDSRVIFSHIFEGGKKLSSSLFPTLDSLLKQHNMKVEDFAYIGVGTGPGSYMGIRTAASIAKALSFAAGVPLIEFLSPIAYLPDKEGSFSFVGDGRMGKLFVLKGIKTSAKIKQIERPELIEKKDLSLHLQNKDFIINSEPRLNIPWLSKYVHQLHLEGKAALSLPLDLVYLH